MAAKIYVMQKGLFHADTEEELAQITHAATKTIREGGGAVVELSETQVVTEGPDKGTFARFIDYYVLKTSLDDLEIMAARLETPSVD